MQVILLKDIEKLGKTGDLKEVSQGYARNFLLPQRLVAVATPSLVAHRDQHIAAEMRKRAKQEAEDKQLAETLSQITLTFQARVGKEGRLYGSITTQDIADALQAQTTMVIDRRKVVLEAPIHKLGTHSIQIKLSNTINATVQISVVEAA